MKLFDSYATAACLGGQWPYGFQTLPPISFIGPALLPRSVHQCAAEGVVDSDLPRRSAKTAHAIALGKISLIEYTEYEYFGVFYSSRHNNNNRRKYHSSGDVSLVAESMASNEPSPMKRLHGSFLKEKVQQQRQR